MPDTLRSQDVSTEAIVPPVSGTVLLITVRPVIAERFIADGAWEASELLPVMVTPEAG